MRQSHLVSRPMIIVVCLTEGSSKQLANPISSDLSNMRTSLWPALCEAASYNLKRQHSTIRFFEVGRKYLVKSAGLEQVDMLAGIAIGDVKPRQWGENARSIDFFDIKGDITQLLVNAGLKGKVDFSPVQSPGIHPGKTAEILIDGEICRRDGVHCTQMWLKFLTLQIGKFWYSS